MDFNRPLLVDLDDETHDQFGSTGGMDQLQQLMAAMASAKFSSSSESQDHDEHALSQLFPKKNSGKINSNLVDNLSHSSASGFTTLLKNTDVHNQLAQAAENGQSVTIFAPSNKAMAKMPDNAAKKMAHPDHRQARSAFAKQHSSIGFETKSAAEMQVRGLSSKPMAFRTVNPNRHVNLEEDEETGRLMVNLYNNKSEKIASARVTQTVYDHETGNKLHVIDSVLQNFD